MRVGSPHGHYELTPFPGCHAIVVSTHAFVNVTERGKGFGQKLHKERLQLACDLGHDYILCTVRSDNLKQIHILEKNGWKELDKFINRETENTLYLYGKAL